MNNFINFLKNHLSFGITNELNINWDGKETVGIFKATTGTKYVNSSVIPFQLIVLTANVPDTLDEINTFIATQHDKFFISNYVYYKQYYYTPVVPTVATPTGNVLTSQIILSGVLTVSENISDITKVEISVNDGTSWDEYITQVRDMIYSTDGTSQVIISGANTDMLGKRNNRGGSLTFSLSFIAQNTTLVQKLRALRQGTLNPNATFKVRFTFTDTGVPGTYPSANTEVYKETYTCKVVNYQYHAENSQLPNYTLTMQTC